MDKYFARRCLLPVVVAAALVNGLLAGGNVDRALVAMPAWRAVGVQAWADFSREADLGNGRIVYPAMAFGGTLLSAIAAGLVVRGRRPAPSATMPAVLAAALMLGSLPVSFMAIPYMQSLRHVSDSDLAGLARAFSGFEYWGRIQGTLHLAAFAANIWSLAALASDFQVIPVPASPGGRC